MILDVNKLLKLQEKCVADWHNSLELKETGAPWNFIEENMKWNFMLWHEEDIARITDIDPMRIVEAKRNIDKFNQARNNSMEKIDEWILNWLDANKIGQGSRIHSETPGMMTDRLAIMALKHYHMIEETLREDAGAEHIEKCRLKAKVIAEQIADLSEALTMVLHELKTSVLRFKVYRQFKMYNDPSLNPELYKRQTNQ